MAVEIYDHDGGINEAQLTQWLETVLRRLENRAEFSGVAKLNFLVCEVYGFLLENVFDAESVDPRVELLNQAVRLTQRADYAVTDALDIITLDVCRAIMTVNSKSVLIDILIDAPKMVFRHVHEHGLKNAA